MKTKTIIGAIIGIVIIILIVVLSQGGQAKEPTQYLDTPSTKQDASDSSSTQTSTTPTPSEQKTVTKPMEETKSGLQVKTLKEGTGEAAVNGDAVSVNYTGMLTDGKVFDSNVDPKFQHVEPLTFTLGQHQVIDGWEQGVLGMKVGEKRHLTIPSDLGYGARGAGSAIPPNATLEFDVEVTAINHK